MRGEFVMLRVGKSSVLILLLVGLFALAGCGNTAPLVPDPPEEPEELEATEVPIPGFDKWTAVVGEWEYDEESLTQKATTTGLTNTNAYVELEQKGKIHE